MSLVFVLGCSAAPRGPGPQAAALAASRVHQQQSAHRPRLTLVEREGDPQRGLALAVHVGTSPIAAAALALLIEDRMRAAGVEAAGHASPSGFIVYALADRAREVARFIEVGNRALVIPVTASDVDRVAARWRSAPPRVARSVSEAAVAQCSGELSLVPAPEGPVGFSGRLEDWLQTVGVGDVAFAVVGSREHLEAGQDALARLAPWSRLGADWSAPFEADLIGSSSGVAGQLSLSVALWGAPAAAAIASAERLGEPESLLSVRLAAGFPAWQVVRVASNLDRGGACLRVDLQATGSAPTAAAVAGSAADAADELEHTLSRIRPGPWVVTKQVLAMEGPHQAAAVAAWQALNASAEGVGTRSLRRIVHYAGELSTRPPERLAELFTSALARRVRGLETKRGVEEGQGKFWMLLATPCGTSAEDAVTAGTLALALHGSALASSSRSGVTLEPWLNVDAMGILAHSAATTPYESPAAQAERVAEALARALLTAGPPPDVIVESREFLLDTLADGPTPSLSLALRQTSANHPSWLEPRGTWSSLSAISSRSVQLRRESFVRGKLRLASLGNHDPGQVESGEARLLNLLRSADAGQGECASRRVVSPVAGKYRIEASGRTDADAIISVPLPTNARGLSEEAVWTELLMNRTDGWLYQALQRPGLVSTARARAMGGAGIGALVIEIHAVDGKREEAVAQVRGLLARLRAGAATAIDARNAQAHLARREAQRRLNPRGRVVDLWYGTPRPAATLESLHALHRLAFEPGREVVVLAEATD